MNTTAYNITKVIAILIAVAFVAGFITLLIGAIAAPALMTVGGWVTGGALVSFIIFILTVL